MKNDKKIRLLVIKEAVNVMLDRVQYYCGESLDDGLRQKIVKELDNIFPESLKMDKWSLYNGEEGGEGK